MADIRSIDIHDRDILVTLHVTSEEFKRLGQRTGNIMMVPIDHDSFEFILTSGRLGNSNRLMLPKRLLDKKGISELRKKVPSKVFELNGDVFLLAKLKDSDIGLPEFKEEMP